MRSIRIRILFFVMFLPHAVSLNAQAPTTSSRDPQAQALLVSSVAATGAGSLQAGGQRTSLKASGSYVIFQGDGTSTTQPIRVWVAGLDRVRWELDTPAGTTVTVVHGRGGWGDSGTGRTPLPANRIKGLRLEAFPMLALVEWTSDLRVSVQSKGEALQAGRRVRRIGVERLEDSIPDPAQREAIRKMSRCELALDETTSLPASLRYQEHPNDWRLEIPVDLSYRDFRRVGSALVPHTISRSVNGMLLTELRFTQFEFGVTIPDWYFSRRQP